VLTMGPVKDVVAAYRKLIDGATTQDLASTATAV